MDAGFIAELRDWAEQARSAFEDQAEVAWHQGEQRTAAVANLAARTFADLRTRTNRRLAAERARLAAAVASAEEGVTAANDRAAWAERAIEAAVAQHLGATIRANYHRRLEEAERDAGDATRALDAARQALANFDAATKGGEG